MFIFIQVQWNPGEKGGRRVAVIWPLDRTAPDHKAIRRWENRPNKCLGEWTVKQTQNLSIWLCLIDLIWFGNQIIGIRLVWLTVWLDVLAGINGEDNKPVGAV